MNYNEFCNWLEKEKITLEYSDLGGYANDTMMFSKDGKWFLNVRENSNTYYDEVKEAILCELDGVMPEVIDEVVIVTEVAEFLNKETSTIRKAIDKAIKDGILIEDKDCRKAKQTWLLKKLAVKKLYPSLSWKELKKL